MLVCGKNYFPSENAGLRPLLEADIVKLLENIFLISGKVSYGLHFPHIKTSIEANLRSGHVCILMWLSANNKTPETPRPDPKL